MKWMARFVSLVLCFALVLSVSVAESMDDDVSQQEKMLRQYELGSGLRGAMKFAVTGESGLASMLSPLNDAEFQIRSILSGKTMSTQLYAVKNDTETAQTEICRMDGQWYLKTSLLLDSTLSLPDRGDLLSTLSSSETLGNPSFYSFILSFLSADPALWKGVNIDASVNKWLEAYVQKPVLINEDNETRMKFQYIVPAADLLSGIKVAMHQMLSDVELQKKLGTLMTEEQKALLLNPEMSWYLDSVIDSIPLTGTGTFERIVTMQGTEVSSHIQIPVVEPKNAWKVLDITTADGQTVYELTGEERRLTWKPTAERSGIIEYASAQSDSIAVMYDISMNSESSVDAEDYHHETTTYILKLSPSESSDDSTEWLDFDPIEIQTRFHFYSKSAKRSATTLEVTLAGLIPGGRIQAAAKFRTTTPWEITLMDTSSHISLENKTSAERIEIGSDILANLLMSLRQLDPAPAETESPEMTTVPEEQEQVETNPAVDSEQPNTLPAADTDAEETDVTEEPAVPENPEQPESAPAPDTETETEAPEAEEKPVLTETEQDSDVQDTVVHEIPIEAGTDTASETEDGE